MLDKTSAEAQGDLTPRLWTMGLTYSEESQEVLAWTHIPLELQDSIDQGDVKHAILSTLKVGGLASRQLQGEPSHVLLAVVTKSGKRVLAVPPVFAQLRDGLRAAGWALMGLGLVLLSQHIAPFSGGVLLTTGSHLLRTAWGVPCSAHVLKMLSHHRIQSH